MRQQLPPLPLALSRARPSPHAAPRPQDIKPANILVNMVLGANSGTLGATSRLELTLGDLNLCQWTRVAEAGR
jgi:hypothetical protein